MSSNQQQPDEMPTKGPSAAPLPVIVTGIPQVPITLERKPFINPEDSPLKSAGS
jgi:hypothetical protein